MARHLPSAHPELAFFRYRLAECLWQQQAGEAKAKAGSEMRCKEFRARARQEAEAAAAALAVAYGKDHPTVAQWRRSFA